MLQEVLDLVPAGIIYLDEHLIVKYSNAAGKAFHGLPPNAKVVGKNMRDLLSEDIVSFVEPMLQETLASAEPHAFLAHIDESGNKVDINHNFRETRYFRTSYTPKLSGQGDIIGVVVLVEDITQIKRAEFEIAEKNHNLEYLIRLLSHDFKEPTRTIANISQLTARRYSDRLDDKGLEYLDYLRTTSTHMIEMVDSLLKFIKLDLEEHELTVTNANELVQQVLATLQSSIAEKKAQIQVDELPNFKGEVVLIRQVFQNLIANALKYAKPDQSPKIEINGMPRGSKVELSVRDNGIGIPPAYHEKVFDPFTRVEGKKSARNLGMGLAICKRIVETHGGAIGLESQPGEGTKVSFTLPAE